MRTYIHTYTYTYVHMYTYIYIYVYEGNHQKAMLINMLILSSRCCSTVDQLLFNFRIIHEFNMLFNS